MSVRYVVGVDPGDSTGLALLVDGVLLTARQDEPTRITRLLHVILQRPDPAEIAIAVERFTPARRPTSHQPTAQQVIGMVQSIADTYRVTNLVEQGAADARACVTDETLRQLGYWQTGAHVGHADASDANSAVRHALLRLSTVRPTQFEALLRTVL